MRVGPKAEITAPPLDLTDLPRSGARRIDAFAREYLTVPVGRVPGLGFGCGRGSGRSSAGCFRLVGSSPAGCGVNLREGMARRVCLRSWRPMPCLLTTSPRPKGYPRRFDTRSGGATAQPWPADGRGSPPVGRILRKRTVTSGVLWRQTHPSVVRKWRRRHQGRHGG